MCSTDGSQKMIVLKSSDGKTFEVEDAVMLESQVIRHMIEDKCADPFIPLPKVTSKILEKVIEYCKRHVEVASDDDLKAFDADFVKVDRNTLKRLILAANYLNIKSLLDLTCQTVADMLIEEILTGYNLKIDQEAVALESQTIKHMIEDNCADRCIPLPNVTSKILANWIEYCKRLVEVASNNDLTAFDADFVKVDEVTVFELVLSANYLNIKRLHVGAHMLIEKIRKSDILKIEEEKEFRRGYYARPYDCYV